jgi:hypothetical protein
MDDMVRGRFDLENGEDVEAVIGELMKQKQFRVKSMEAPRRPVKDDDGKLIGHGYPRYHVILQDPESGLTHEWQIGTKAMSLSAEKKGIRMPKKLQVKLGISQDKDRGDWKKKYDFHDVEYAILRNVCKAAEAQEELKGDHFPAQEEVKAAVEKWRVKAFSAKVDKLSAEAGTKGDKTPNLEERVAELHHRATIILHALTNDLGEEFLAHFAHG